MHSYKARNQAILQSKRQISNEQMKTKWMVGFRFLSLSLSLTVCFNANGINHVPTTIVWMSVCAKILRKTKQKQKQKIHPHGSSYMYLINIRKYLHVCIFFLNSYFIVNWEKERVRAKVKLITCWLILKYIHYYFKEARLNRFFFWKKRISDHNSISLQCLSFI